MTHDDVLKLINKYDIKQNSTVNYREFLRTINKSTAKQIDLRSFYILTLFLSHFKKDLLDDEDEFNASQEQLNEAKKPSPGAKLAQQKEVFNRANTEKNV